MDLSSLALLSPSVALFVFGLLILAFIGPLMQANQGARPDSRQAVWITAAGLAVALALDIVNMGAVAEPHKIFDGMAIVDRYSVFFNTVFLAAALGALLLGHEYLERVGVRVPEYYALVLFGTLGMSLLAVANDLILLFLAIEIMSIATYVLCAINRGVATSLESGFKYFILGAFSSAILLYGIAMVYGATGTTRFDYIGAWFEAGHSVSESPVMAAGLAMLLVGFGFKVAAAPFHTWSPDVYEGAPTPVTAYMSTGVKVASFAAMGRFFFVALPHAQQDWSWAIWAMAALTILVGNIGALVQQDFKRMLAYSSVAHAGYLLMAFVALPENGSLQDNPRISGLLFYSVAYTIMSLGAFAVVSLMVKNGADDTKLDRLAGLASRSPWIAAGLAVCLVSLAGIPPTAGFVGKFYLFASAVEGGSAGLAVVGAIGGAIGVYYYLRPIVLMYMRPAGDDPWIPADSPVATGTLVACVTLVLLLGLYPSPLVDWARESLMSLSTWDGAVARH
jgi:NADH-quinone oxidoreductase subunit N